MGREIDEVSGIVVDAAFKLHTELGPGLLESVYQTVLSRDLTRRGLHVVSQSFVPFEYDGLRFDEALRVDLLVESQLVVELKSIEELAPVHFKQVLTYLRLLKLQVGLLINFGAPTFKEGIHRVVNKYSPSPSAASRLRVNQPPKIARGGAENAEK